MTNKNINRIEYIDEEKLCIISALYLIQNYDIFEKVLYDTDYDILITNDLENKTKGKKIIKMKPRWWERVFGNYILL